MDEPNHLKHENGVSDAGINAAGDYANWGGEFVDDAFRFGEQPIRTRDDWPADPRHIT